jgi:polyphosphate kinase
MFYNNGQTEFYLGSADWMNRNLHSRIEVIFPVYDEILKNELSHILQMQLSDTKKAMYLTKDLKNIRIDPGTGESSVAAQECIYNYVKNIG